MCAQVVLLNGVGSAGKSSIAKALQTICTEVYLHVQMDTFLDMLPEAMLDDPQGFLFETGEEAGRPAVRISTGPVGDRLMEGMRRAVASLADAGNQLIVDEVATAADIADYRERLAGHDLVIVAVMAPLDILESRERERGDRMIGLARWQYFRMHTGIEYDLTIDASALSALECAEEVRARLERSIL